MKARIFAGNMPWFANEELAGTRVGALQWWRLDSAPNNLKGPDDYVNENTFALIFCRHVFSRPSRSVQWVYDKLPCKMIFTACLPLGTWQRWICGWLNKVGRKVHSDARFDEVLVLTHCLAFVCAEKGFLRMAYRRRNVTLSSQSIAANRPTRIYEANRGRQIVS